MKLYTQKQYDQFYSDKAINELSQMTRFTLNNKSSDESIKRIAKSIWQQTLKEREECLKQLRSI